MLTQKDKNKITKTAVMSIILMAKTSNINWDFLPKKIKDLVIRAYEQGMIDSLDLLEEMNRKGGEKK